MIDWALMNIIHTETMKKLYIIKNLSKIIKSDNLIATIIATVKKYIFS